MKVIGIDPAPVKASTIFDGEIFHVIPANELKEWLSKLDEKNILICWDAPLTSFSEAYLQKSKDTKEKTYESNFYTRKIEHIIKYKMEDKPPSGISTMPYGSCPHWTITQHCLGLPQLFNGYTPPFKLITNTDHLTHEGHYVVEVHPALALWSWLKNDSKTASWKYKNKKIEENKDFIRLKQEIQRKLTTLSLPMPPNLDDIFHQIKNDDYIDAFIAWALGSLWLQNNNEVALVGNKESGAILLPKTNWSDDLNYRIHT